MSKEKKAMMNEPLDLEVVPAPPTKLEKFEDLYEIVRAGHELAKSLLDEALATGDTLTMTSLISLETRLDAAELTADMLTEKVADAEGEDLDDEVEEECVIDVYAEV